MESIPRILQGVALVVVVVLKMKDLMMTTKKLMLWVMKNWEESLKEQEVGLLVGWV
jgi:hypothetical protein